jgi:NAD(P)-dependent dehydrogenase (short-subunit alcohol dehydrogenase family)
LPPTPPTSPQRKLRSSRRSPKFGKLDIVFANAGIAGGTPLGSATLETFEKVISTNITAVFFTVQAAVPHLNDGASIILNGSVISVLGNPGYSAYAASKAGVRAMARVMASELSPRNIRVNVVSPGAIRTPIWGAALATPEAEKAFEKAHRRTRSHFEDGAVPRLRRCRAYPGAGVVRRWRCYGLAERRTDLSGVSGL